MRYAGSQVLVTGAGRGIGRAVAERFAMAGGHVVAADLDPSTVHALADELRGRGASADPLVLDVSEPDAMAAAGHQLVGGVDVVVANAGIQGFAKASEVAEIVRRGRGRGRLPRLVRGLVHHGRVPERVRWGRDDAVSTLRLDPTPSGRREGLLTTPDEAVRHIPKSSRVAVGGTGSLLQVPETLLAALERRWLAEKAPGDLDVVHVMGLGDYKGRGIDHIAIPGLVRRFVGSHFVLSPRQQGLIAHGEVEAVGSATAASSSIPTLPSGSASLARSSATSMSKRG
jgi:hypothetical protein